MKRKVKTERIIILLLSLIVILQSVFLIIVLSAGKKNSACSSEEKNNLAKTTEITCGDDSDISRFMCIRFREPGYIVTYKDNLDDNKKHEVLNKLMNILGTLPAMYVDKTEINNVLRNTYGLQTEKDFGIDSFIFIPNYNSTASEDKVKEAVKNIKELDKVITFKVSE